MPANLTNDGAGRWSVSGELDFATVPVLWRQLAPQLGAGDAVLDLGAVQRSNSAALALLLEARERVHGGGGQLQVQGLPASLRQLGQVSGLDGLLAEISD